MTTTTLTHTLTGEPCEGEQSNDNPDLCEHGIAAHDEYDEPEDRYWSGTGELVDDDSYIDYLNRY